MDLHRHLLTFAWMFGIAELIIAKPGEHVSIFHIDNAMCKISCNHFLSRSRLGKPTWNSLSSLVTEELLQITAGQYATGCNRGHMHTGYKRQGLAHKCTTVYVDLRGVTLTDANNVYKHDFAHLPCLHCKASRNLGNVLLTIPGHFSEVQ